MKTFNVYYENQEQFRLFLHTNAIKDSQQLLVQIFCAFNDKKIIQNLITVVDSLLPSSHIIGATTDGEIFNAHASIHTIVISLTIFENTTLQSYGIKRTNDCYHLGEQMAKAILNDDTKVLITFTDGMHTNGENYLEGIHALSPHITVAGGLAGDEGKLEKTYAFTRGFITDNGAVGVSLSNSSLHVHTDYNFNWTSIGKELTITKAEKNRVYTIDNKTACEIYAYYLGKDIADNLPNIGLEFPLVLSSNGIVIARAALEKHEDGSLTFAGNLHTGDKVRIGFGNGELILKDALAPLKRMDNKPIESIFIYSCMARRRFMQETINIEIEPLSQVAPVCGFFTYGEFFGTESKVLLNQTMTILALSESNVCHHPLHKSLSQHLLNDSSSIKALSHFINVTSDELIQTNERLSSAIEGSNDGMWSWDIATHEVYFSPRAKAILGYNDTELENTFNAWESRIHPLDKRRVLPHVQACLLGKKETFSVVFRLKHKNETWVWINARGKIFRNNHNKPSLLSGFFTDTTEQKKSALEKEEQSTFLQSIINGIDSPVMVMDSKDVIILANVNAQQFFVERFFCNPKAPTYNEIYYQTSCKQIIHTSFNPLHKALDENTTVSTISKRIDKFGTSYDMEISITPLTNTKGERIGAIEVAHDISGHLSLQNELAEQKNSLKHLAHHDTLTGLPNRLLFSDRLSQAIKKAKRANGKVAVLFVDLDHFKKINDSMGHEFGDEVLMETAKRFKHSMRESDTLARLGGDEFIVIMDEIDSAEDTAHVAQKMVNNITPPIYIEGRPIYVTASIGISMFPNDGEDTSSLLKNADAAMYKAKDEGGNNYQFYNEMMTKKAFERIVMEMSLIQALKNNEFIVHYQPQVYGHTNSIIGMEALVRWNNPIMGLTPPGKFIPIAEETGLIVELDKFVMKTAMTQLVQWYKDGYNPGILALNLSIKQLREKSFVEDIKKLLEITHCQPSWVEFEITESQMMKNPLEMVPILNELKALGINFAMDDFGTGYSSLSQLKRLPIGKIKIDQSFIHGLPHDMEDAALVKAIISIAKNLNLNIIAEGVETKEQRDFLLKNGCENIQGYFYGKPMPHNEIEVYFQKTNE